MNGHLAAQSILATAFTTNVFYDEADQTNVLPFSIVKLDSVNPHDDKDGVSHFDDDFVYVTHFGATAKKAAEMALSARTALDRKIAGTYNGIVTESVQFLTQRSDSEFIDNHTVKTIEQLYKLITKP